MCDCISNQSVGHGVACQPIPSSVCQVTLRRLIIQLWSDCDAQLISYTELQSDSLNVRRKSGRHIEGLFALCEMVTLPKLGVLIATRLFMEYNVTVKITEDVLGVLGACGCDADILLAFLFLRYRYSNITLDKINIVRD